MNPRATIALAVIVAAVAAYIFAVDRPQAQRAEEARHLVQLAKPEIAQVSLTTAKGTVDLARAGASHWRITHPYATPADSFAVGGLLDAVTGIVPQRTLRDAGENLAAYGLDRPAVRMTLRSSAGKTVTLELGKASPVATAIYARLDPGRAVYLVDSGVKNALSKSAADLRRKTVADFANADVQRVRIMSPKGVLALDRTGPDRWRLAGAHPWPADDFAVTDLFFPLTTSDAKRFHDGVSDLAAYGLDHPDVTVDLTLAGRAAPLRILLARKGKVTYATVAGSPTVFELDGTVEDKLTPRPIALASKLVLPYNPADLTSVVWRHRDKTLEIRRQGPGFTGSGLSDADVSGMFSAINLLNADMVRPLTAPPAGAPAFEIRTEGAADARFAVRFYAQPGGKWLATDPGLGLEYTLAADTLSDLPAPIRTFLGLPQPKKKTAAPSKPGTPATPAVPHPAASPAHAPTP